MSHWENIGKSNEWYTPKYVFDAMACVFDLDVAHPKDKVTSSTSLRFIYENSLTELWTGFVWMNPPFEGRNGIAKWLDKFFEHGDGVCLTPDRTSVKWWQDAYKKCDGCLFVSGKIKFIDKTGKEGKSPSNGTTLFAVGEKGIKALLSAKRNGLGECVLKSRLEEIT